MDKLIGGMFEGGAITDENRWIAYAVLVAALLGLALLAFAGRIGRAMRRKRRRHREML